MAMLAEKRTKTRYFLYHKTQDTRGNAWCEDKSKFGQRMLQKMGWSEGKGLGANENGSTDPVRVNYKWDSKGMGYNGTDGDEAVAQQKDFDALLATLSQESNVDNVEVKATSGKSPKSLEMMSQKSRARVHYHKFTRGKDLSRASNKDLASILGIQLEETKPKAAVPQPTVTPDVGPVIDASMETTFGITTIARGNITEYFKQKFNERKQKKESAESEEMLKSDSTNSSETTRMEESTVSEGNESNSDDAQKKKKKKKKSKNVEDEAHICNTSILSSTIVDDNGTPASKGRRKSVTWGDVEVSFVSKYIKEMADSSSDSVDKDVSLDVADDNNTEDTSSKKKKKKKKKDAKQGSCESELDNNASESRDDDVNSGQSSESVFEGLDCNEKKKKKRKKDREMESLVQIDHTSTSDSKTSVEIEVDSEKLAGEPENINSQETAERKKKKKKKSGCEDTSIETGVDVNEDVPIIVEHISQDTDKKKKKKKKNTDCQSIQELDGNIQDDDIKLVYEGEMTKKMKKKKLKDLSDSSDIQVVDCKISSDNTQNQSSTPKRKKQKLKHVNMVEATVVVDIDDQSNELGVPADHQKKKKRRRSEATENSSDTPTEEPVEKKKKKKQHLSDISIVQESECQLKNQVSTSEDVPVGSTNSTDGPSLSALTQERIAKWKGRRKNKEETNGIEEQAEESPAKKKKSSTVEIKYDPDKPTQDYNHRKVLSTLGYNVKTATDKKLTVNMPPTNFEGSNLDSLAGYGQIIKSC